MQRYKLTNGKELIVINTHFEAYDDGSVKKQQMALTKNSGRWICPRKLCGFRWRLEYCPAIFNVHSWEKEKEDDQLLPDEQRPNYITGWTYAYDSTTATNRKNKFPHDPKTTFYHSYWLLFYLLA